MFGINDQIIIKYITYKKYCKIYVIKDLATDKPFFYIF